MLSQYRLVTRQRVLFSNSVWRRWNSQNITGDVNKTQQVKIETSKDDNNVDNIKTHADVHHEYLEFPWERESLDIPESITGEDLPWDDSTNSKTNNNEQLQKEDETINAIADVIDPSKNELILAPLKKKTSPIQKLKQKSPSLSDNLTSETNNYQLERDYRSLLQFTVNDPNDDFISLIEELKPSSSVVTLKQLSQLSQTLDKSFKLKQLRQYIESSCPEIQLKKSTNKKKMINLIISEHWKLKVTLDPTGDLVSETKIDLSNKRDLFLLLSNKGFLPQHWSLIGAQLSLNSSRKQLVVRGSANIVNFVNASWNDLLNNVSNDTLELKEVLEFYKKNGKKLNIKKLQYETGVFFDKISYSEEEESTSYLLTAIKNLSINKAKTEILKATQYRVGNNTVVINDLIEECKDSINQMDINDESLPWFISNKDYFRYSKPKPRLRESLLVDDYINVESLSNEVQDLKIEVEIAKEKFEYNYIATKTESLHNEKSKESDNKFFKLNNNEKDINSAEPIDDIYKSIDIDKLETELNSAEMKNDPTKLMLDNVISVKFGKLLFERKSGDKNSYFNENLSEVVRQISKLNLMDKESTLFGSTGGIFNRFNKQIHIKLIPNGFWDNKFSNLTKYPSIDILINLNDNKLTINNFTSFISEAENNVEIGLPSLNIDLKFQNSYNSMLVYNLDQWVLNGRLSEDFKHDGPEEDNEVLLNKKQINMFISQIGKRKLDIKFPNDLRELIRQFSSKPYTFVFGKEKVKYSTVSVEFVRSIELEYENSPVSFEIRDDGRHEKVEVSMLKESDVPLDVFTKRSVSLAHFLGL